jgi:hypothetical protein
MNDERINPGDHRGHGDGTQRRTDEVELLSKELRIEQKRFYFNLKENSRGRFLKIAEVSGGRSTIIVPVSGWVEFRDMLNDFIDESQASN